MKVSLDVNSPPPLVIDRGVLRSAVKDAGEGALRAARQGWPVDTGKSAQALAVEMTADGLGFVLVSEAPYAKHINAGRTLSEAGARSEASLATLDEVMADLILSQFR
jgi:hypothetical protein